MTTNSSPLGFMTLTCTKLLTGVPIIRTRVLVRSLLMVLMILTTTTQARGQVFRKFGGSVDRIPVAFDEMPNQQQLLAELKVRSEVVRQLSSNISVSMAGIPKIKGTLQIEFPDRMRMKAGLLGVSEMGVDVGSNREHFWIWTRASTPGQPPTFYFANHAAFERSPVRKSIPLDPKWLMEGLGVVRIAPTDVHHGPFMTDGRWMKFYTVRQTSTGQVAARSKADSQTHEELAADRISLAASTWKLVMDGVESETIPSNSFLTTGSTSESRLTDVSRLCEKLAPKIAKALRASTKGPLVKGNISVFVFDKRYDFSEFGKMIEQRDFPKSVSGHWGYTTIDAYATILMTRNQTAEDVQVPLAYQIASLYTADLAPDMPRWFCDGVGLWTAKRILAKEDSMQSLESRAKNAAASMVKPDDFVQNRMPSDQAALVSYLFIKELRSNSGAYAKLMKLLGERQSFEKSFTAVYGKTPSQLLGQQERTKRN